MTLKIQICEKSSLPFLTKIFSFINFNYKKCYQMKKEKYLEFNVCYSPDDVIILNTPSKIVQLTCYYFPFQIVRSMLQIQLEYLSKKRRTLATHNLYFIPSFQIKFNFNHFHI